MFILLTEKNYLLQINYSNFNNNKKQLFILY